MGPGSGQDPSPSPDLVRTQRPKVFAVRGCGAVSGGEARSVCREKKGKAKRERNGLERDDDRSSAGTGHPDVLQRSSQTSLHAP